MTSRAVTFSSLFAMVLFAGVAAANEPPPFQADPISLDRASPSVVLFGNTTADIYGEAGGPVGFGWDVGGPGPILHVPDFAYGLGPADNQDGHSNGEMPFPNYVIYFSGDDMSRGAPGTWYRHQFNRRQAAGDRYVVNGFTSVGIPPVLAGGGPAAIIGPVLPGPANLLSLNQTGYNEIPSVPWPVMNPYVPPAGSGATRMDDMDALELTPFDTDFPPDGIHNTPIYFTVDMASPAWGPGLGADILVSPPGVPGFGLFAPAPALGLGPDDEVDALAVWDLDGDLMATPGLDYAIYSLAPGSPYLAAFGLSPADVLATGFGGASVLYLPAAALGMLPTDNIDALDVEPFLGPGSIELWERQPPLPPFIPEPSTLMLVVIGSVMLAGRLTGCRRRMA